MAPESLSITPSEFARADRAPPSPPAVSLAAFDIEKVRVSHERTYAGLVERHPIFESLMSKITLPSPQELRRSLLAETLRLSESMVPDAYGVAHQVQQRLGVTGALELYQRKGSENAAMHFVVDPILLELNGSLLSQLDPRALAALIGHELGHYLAHGPTSPVRGARVAAAVLGGQQIGDERLTLALSRFSMMCELTADRVGLLACQDLSAALRLEMICVSGLGNGDLVMDTDAYLAQCKELVELELASGSAITSDTHPSHGLRVYAISLFSETRTYRELTGRGPGTRELADVDAIIGRYFDREEAIPLDHSQLGDAPRELAECALAAAVIVAHADGVMTDDEQEVIEKWFSSTIPDWQEYLDLQVALERFGDTATVLAATARELAPMVMHLLIEVMVADGEIHDAEIGAILRIGHALRVDFSRPLWATLKQLGITRTEVSAPAPELPLPARRQDVDDALQTFLSGVVRRGESTITLRRLLRLLGADQHTNELAAKLEVTLTRQRITIDKRLSDVGLDEPLVLTPAVQLTRGAAVTPLTGSRPALVAALRRLREQLVSGDGRSPSVRLRGTRRGRAFDLAALEKISLGQGLRVLTQVRARKAVKLVDAGDAGRHSQASVVASDLLALAREDAHEAEETGARDLYVGYPFVTGGVAGYLVRAPLVLYPVELVRDGAGARGFRLEPRRDELPIANQSLIRLVFNKRNFAFSDELADELEALAGDPDGDAEAVRRRLAEVGMVISDGPTELQSFTNLDDTETEEPEKLTIEEVAVLGMFPQSSSDLLQDYDGLLQDLARPDANVRELLAAAATLLPGTPITAPQANASDANTDWTPVIVADPSQRSVINEARRHGATVVDGPPGTGKSQVIVNLVAEALRRGERVAVVCEKRAALDVVRQRMTAIGLGKALAVVHDVYEDRKPLYAHVAGRLEIAGRVPFAADEALKAHTEHTGIAADLVKRAAALTSTPPGLDLTVGELLAFVAQRDPSSLPAAFSAIAGLNQLPQAGLRTLLELTNALHPLVDVWAPSSYWRRAAATASRPSLANARPAVIRELEVGLERAVEAARVFEGQVASLPPEVTVEKIVKARVALTTAVTSRLMRSDERDRTIFGAIAHLAADEPERLRETEKAQQAWREASTQLLHFNAPISLSDSPALASSLSVLTRWSGTWSRIFVLGWWRARGLFRAELTKRWPDRAGDALTPTLLHDIRDQLFASRAWRTIGTVFSRLGLEKILPTSASQLQPAIERVSSMAENLRELGAARNELQVVGAWLPEGHLSSDDLTRWDRVVDDRITTVAAQDALITATKPLLERFPWLGALPSSSTLEELLTLWRKDGARIFEADSLFAKATALLPSARQLFDAIAVHWRASTAQSWRSGVAAAWGSAWVTRLERENPTLGALGHGADDREVTRLAARFGELEVERRDLEIERTLSRLDDAELLTMESAGKHQRRTPVQKAREELLKEARKQRMLMPLRTFVRRFAPIGLLDVTPVWLLSPETMAILFPRQPLFDLVVFDEASQCTVEAGLPVLLRAKRVVIAGDEKQMPPSSYFSMGGGDDDESLAGTIDADESHDALRDLLTAESLLSLARPRVARTGLEWHYRCRDEALIAFSNHAMYQGGLLTIPSTAGAAAPSVLHWVSVEGGQYNAGENVVEAHRVVDVVSGLLSRTPQPTIGVVTFNLKQRKAVLDAIDARCGADSIFRERWTDASAGALDERPFVKNLEQVQGDERDVIVFSLGHAPQIRNRGGVATGETYVPARFGPLGQRGGERRLNVAISRAKSACYVVASFDPSQLTVASSKHQGPRLFKHFLEFAHLQHQGRRLEAGRVLDLVRAGKRADGPTRHRLPIEGFVPLQIQLALALEAAGIPYESDVGTSSFRIPLAILDPRDPTKFALALLLQDGNSGTDPFDLHVHRPDVLKLRGWRTLLITAASWRRRGSELLEEIETLVPGCKGAATSDIYQRHRAAQAHPVDAANSASSAAPPDRRSRSTSGNPLFEAVISNDVEIEPSARPAPATPNRPAWALNIVDDLFRAALMYLDRHGEIGEGELSSIVGGPRRVRVFARELDTLRVGLPFGVEVTDVGGAKVYRKVAAS